MRIKDLALMPFEIEVTNVGYTLLRIGVVEAEGPNKGCKKEITEGYFSRHPSSLSALLEKVVFDKVITDEQKMSLAEFLMKYEQEFKALRDRVEKIVTKLIAPLPVAVKKEKTTEEVGDA